MNQIWFSLIIFSYEFVTINSAVSQTGKRLLQYRCTNCFCGTTTQEWTRVVGGSPAMRGDHPWMVALLYRNKLFCAGTIITDVYVLTAAHCLRSISDEEIYVVLSDGKYLDMKSDYLDKRRVLFSISHPNFHYPRQYNNDVALLHLDRPLRTSFERTPVCLPMPGRSYAGEMAQILGWGLTSEKGNVSSELLQATVPILSQNTCRSLNGFMTITDGMMCASPLAGGIDACQGDSGGPLLIQAPDGRLVIVGIVSWGIGCGRPNKPGIYTRVNHYLDWILEHTRDSCYCY